MPAVLSQRTVSPAHVLKLGRWGAAKSSDALPDAALPADAVNLTDAADWSLMWQLQRNCSLTPRQLMASLGGLIFVSLGVSSLMWHFGAPYVWLFAMLEVMALLLAMLMHARHAADQDFIGLRPELLRVETRRAGQVLRWDFNPRWVRIEPRDADGSLVRLYGHGKSVDVGRFVRADLRQQLASELRWAVRQLTH